MARVINCLGIGALVASFSTAGYADILPGLTSDFEDGTVQGWAGGAVPTHVPSGGPEGVDDGFMRIGVGGRLAVFNSDEDHSGVLDPSVAGVSVDLMRSAEEPSPLEMRIVFFDPTTITRWTSAVARTVPNDGVWRNYYFSVSEEDLVRVQGDLSYEETFANVDRTMLRHDPDPPDATGVFVAGVLGIDNFAFVPEPAGAALVALAGVAALAARKRRG